MHGIGGGDISKGQIDAERAAIAIQRGMREYWKRTGKEFPSQKLDRIYQDAQKQIESIGMCEVSKPVPGLFISRDIPLNVSVGERIMCVLDPADDHSGLVEGYYRLPSSQDEESEGFFESEHALRIALQKLGFGEYLLHAVPKHFTIDLDKWFQTFGGPLEFTTPNNGLDELLACKDFNEAVAKAESFSPEKRKEIWELIKGVEQNLPAVKKLQFYLMGKMILRAAQVKGRKNFQQKTAEKKVHQTSVAHFESLLCCCPGSSNTAIDHMPEKEKRLLQKLVEDTEAIQAGSFLDTCLTRFYDLDADEKKLFCSLLSRRSFESLLVVSLLLALPDLDPYSLTFSLTENGKINLNLSLTQLKVYPDQKNPMPDYSWLTCFDLIDLPISKNMVRQIQLWDPEEILSHCSGLSSEQKECLKKRLQHLKMLAEENSEMSLRELVDKMHPVWLFSDEAIQWSQHVFEPLSSTIGAAQQAPKTHHDLLASFKPRRHQIQWKKLKAYKKEVEGVVAELMPIVVDGVDRFIEQTHQSERRRPYMEVEDRGRLDKWVGVNCCGPTSDYLALYLRSLGYPAEVVESKIKDHAFIKIPTPFGDSIFIDPTFKQLFHRSEHASALYWEKLPPALVGTRKDFMNFYRTHKGEIIPGAFRWLFKEGSKAIGHYFEYRPQVSDPGYRSHLPEHEKKYYEICLEGFQHHPLDKADVETVFQRTAKKPSEVSASSNELEQIVRNRIEPLYVGYMKRAYPLSHWDKASHAMESALELEKMPIAMTVCGYLLKEQGYRVEHLFSSQSDFSSVLQVHDVKGNVSIVIPAFRAWLMSKEQLDKDKITCRADDLPITFVGTIPEFEMIVQELLSDEAKADFPEGYRWIEGIDFFGLLIHNMGMQVKNPAEMADSGDFQELYMGIFLQNQFFQKNHT